MNTAKAYLHGVQDIERMLRMKCLQSFLEYAGLIFLCFFTTARLLDWFGHRSVFNSALIYPAAGLALISGLLLALYAKKSLFHQLMAIDRDFQLHDRLSTAYEYIQQKKQSPFLDALIRDAGKALGQIDPKKIFPKKISWIHITLGVLMAINLLLAATPNPFLVKAPDAVDPDTKKKIQRMIRQYSMDSSKKESDPDKRPAHGAGRERMDDISRMLDNPLNQKKHLRAAIHKTLMAVQSDKIAFARDLLKELGLDGVNQAVVQQIQQTHLLTRYQLEELNKMLAKMFDNQIPQAIADDLATLEKHHRLEAYLKEILQSLEKGSGRTAVPQEGLGEGSARPAAGNAPADTNRNDSQQPADSPADGDSDRRVTSTETQRAAEVTDGSSDAFDDNELAYGPSSAGLEKSQNKNGAPDALDQVKGPAVQDKAAASQESELAVLIRSLTAIGKAKVEEEEILKDYQQAVEAVMQKENIPLSYRRIIQNYFLSIKLRKEPSSHGRTP